MASRKEGFQTYVYKDKNLIATVPTTKDAAELANTTSTTVSLCALNRKHMPFKGYWFSYTPLTNEQLEDIYTRTQKSKAVRRSNDECKVKEGRFEYDVNCKDHLVTHIPRNRVDRIEQLKRMIWNSNYKRWMELSPQLAALEKVAYREILNSLL